jgi:hypothetical protein
VRLDYAAGRNPSAPQKRSFAPWTGCARVVQGVRLHRETNTDLEVDRAQNLVL